MHLALSNSPSIRHEKASTFPTFEELDQYQAMIINGGATKKEDYIHALEKYTKFSLSPIIVVAVGALGWLSCSLLPSCSFFKVRAEMLHQHQEAIKTDGILYHPAQSDFTLFKPDVRTYREEQIQDLQQIVKKADLFTSPEYIIDHIPHKNKLISEDLLQNESGRQKLITWCKAYQNQQKLEFALTMSKAITYGGVIFASITYSCMYMTQKLYKKANELKDPVGVDRPLLVRYQNKIMGVAAIGIALLSVGGCFLVNRLYQLQRKKFKEIDATFMSKRLNILWPAPMCHSLSLSYRKTRENLKVLIKHHVNEYQPKKHMAQDAINYGLSQCYIKEDIQQQDLKVLMKWCESYAVKQETKKNKLSWIITCRMLALFSGFSGLFFICYDTKEGSDKIERRSRAKKNEREIQKAH